MTTALAIRIAADIVDTADQYPAVRSCRSFSALHDVYDVNESIIAAAGEDYLFPYGGPMPEHVCDAVNAATDALDAILEAEGFDGLVRLVPKAV